MENKSDGQSTSWLRTQAHTRIQILIVVKNDITGTLKGSEAHYPTMEKGPVLLRPDKHKGNSKSHKMDEKAPILRCTFLHQNLDFNCPSTPSTLSKI